MSYYGYVYKNTAPNGKIYVGKRESSTFDDKYYGSGTIWKKVLNKYGKNSILREVLDWADSKEELCALESYWIYKLKSQNPAIGYNLADGGNGGANKIVGIKISKTKQNWSDDERATFSKNNSNAQKKLWADGTMTQDKIDLRTTKWRETLFGNMTDEKYEVFKENKSKAGKASWEKRTKQDRHKIRVAQRKSYGKPVLVMNLSTNEWRIFEYYNDPQVKNFTGSCSTDISPAIRLHDGFIYQGRGKSRKKMFKVCPLEYYYG